jgi:ABC-type Fe3+ transport system substrate-binding protein
VAGSPNWDLIKQGAPITTLCPQPGCVVTQFYPVLIKGAPHPNAAKAWIEFWLTKEGQELLAEWGNSPARADVRPHPERDYRTHTGIAFPDEQWERNTSETIKWIVGSRLFDY